MVQSAIISAVSDPTILTMKTQRVLVGFCFYMLQQSLAVFYNYSTYELITFLEVI